MLLTDLGGGKVALRSCRMILGCIYIVSGNVPIMRSVMKLIELFELTIDLVDSKLHWLGNYSELTFLK